SAKGDDKFITTDYLQQCRAKHPDCRGITVDELQKIQFDRLDFTNFYEDLMNNQKIPDSGVLTQKVKEQIADQLKQAGQ
ncbi:hypothetical protein ACPDHR_24425, partial [Escherichia coli]